jgi:hypothetical protein
LVGDTADLLGALAPMLRIVDRDLSHVRRPYFRSHCNLASNVWILKWPRESWQPHPKKAPTVCRGLKFEIKQDGYAAGRTALSWNTSTSAA